MSRMTIALGLALAALALTESPAVAKASLHEVYWHLDAYDDWGGCGEVADSQAHHTRCLGTGQSDDHTDPFVGGVSFSWKSPGTTRCHQNATAKALHFDKQVLVSLMSDTTNALTAGVLCGYTNHAMSSPALVVPGDHLMKINNRWVWPRTTGTDPHQAGQRGGPLHINLIHRRMGAFGVYTGYTMIIRGFLEY